MVEALRNTEQIADKLSSFSNWIQILVNGFALTVILVCPVCSSISEIQWGFFKFDAKIMEMNLKLNSAVDSGKVKILTAFNIICCVLFLFYKATFEIYVLIVRYQIITSTYWLVTFFPSIVQSTAVCVVICMLIAFYIRLKKTHEILENEKISFSRQKYVPAIPRHKRNYFRTASFDDCHKPRIPMVFHAFNSLWDLGNLIEKFFGPIFLAFIASIFVVTTVQIYYCYVLIASSQSESKGYSVWTLVVALNDILWNIVTVVYLTTLCEMITNMVNVKFK
jgi:hypothetical protein